MSGAENGAEGAKKLDERNGAEWSGERESKKRTESGAGGRGAGAEVRDVDFNAEWQNSPLRSNVLVLTPLRNRTTGAQGYQGTCLIISKEKAQKEQTFLAACARSIGFCSQKP